MKQAAEIIILSRETDRARNMAFLFRLSNCRVTHIFDDNEAVNFLVHQQSRRQQTSLLAIFDPERHLTFLRMLDELDRRDAMLPILLVYESAPLNLGQLKCKPELFDFIQQCRSTESHVWLRRVISGDTSPSVGLAASNQH